MLTAVKTSIQTVNNSETLVDDDHLTLTVEPSSRYIAELYISYVTNSTADLRTVFSVDGSSPNVSITWDNVDGDNLNTVDRYIGSSLHVFNAGTANTLQALGSIETDANTSTVKLRWAQGTATVVNTTLTQGCWMKLIRIA
jgi:hypothetical protein